MASKVTTKRVNKRINGSGSVWSYEGKSGRTMWAVSLSVVDPTTGGTRRETKRGFDTQAEAEEWRSENARKAQGHLRALFGANAVRLPRQLATVGQRARLDARRVPDENSAAR